MLPRDAMGVSRTVDSGAMVEDEKRGAALTETSLLTVLFLGTNPVAVKVAVAELPPLPFVAVRFTAAGLLLLGLVALLKTGGRPGGGTCCLWRGWASSASGRTTWPSRWGWA